MSVLEAKTEGELIAIIDFRYKILREPWGQLRDTVTDTLEQVSVNAYIKNEFNSIIACGRLQKNSEYVGQIRFMAVDNDEQRKGLGKKIVQYLEDRASKMGLTTLELQARENALEFYKSMGFVVVEKTFLLWSEIQHYLMKKKI